MKTMNNKLDINDLNVISENKVFSQDPFIVDISEKKLELEFKSIGDFEWRDDDFLIIDMEFEGTSRTFLNFDFYIGETKRVHIDYSVIPNHRIKVAVSMNDLKVDKWFLKPQPGNFKGHSYGIETHISKINRVVIYTSYIRNAGKFTIYDAYISKELPDFTVTGNIMVDKFGQNAACEFNGKFHSEEELVIFLKSQHEKALKSEGYKNPDWNKYGGYKKLKFDKTGYFHTHFDGNRWWLVDPDGCAFLSNGICYGNRMGVHGFIDGMENLFEWLPEYDDTKYKQAWTTADNIPEFVKRNGEEVGKTRRMFNFGRANMIRAFGNDWWNKWVEINSARLREWGFNTISVCVNNYFDENVYEYLKKAKIPYTWTLKNFPKTKKMIYRDFPDVFSPEYKELCLEFAKQLEPISDDPYMIGYFINNEPEWSAEDLNVAERLLVSKEDLYSKKEIVRFLKEKYKDVEQFNNVWGLGISEFDDLLSSIDEELLKKDEIIADLEEFKYIMISAYNEIPAKAVKKYAPNNMCLGMRYPFLKEGDFAGGEFYDSFSFNCYKRNPEKLFNMANNGTKIPFMIGEWHYGSWETEYLCTALIACVDEEERGKACSNYIKKSYSNYQLIGAHYFEFNDQPLLGRFDGEAMPHGIISVTNRPHEKCLEFFAKANYQIYEIALGIDDIPIYDVQFKEIF